jgi:superoxide dismutase, Cu-Zn family
MMQRSLAVLGVALIGMGLGACRPAEERATAPFTTGDPADGDQLSPPGEAAVRVAAAELRGPDGTVVGVVSFTEAAEGVHVVARVEGLEGNGPRGIHLHEVGICLPPDFVSAGGHFSPDEHPHGGPDDPERHAGDFGNVEIGSEGTGHLEVVTDRLTLDRGPRSAVGRAVVLHEQRDDLRTQPTGDAGGRVACGVVELVPSAVEDEDGGAPPG